LNIAPIKRLPHYSSPQFEFTFDSSVSRSLDNAAKHDIYKGIMPTLIKHPFEDGNISMVVSTDMLNNKHQLDTSTFPTEVNNWLKKASKGLISDITHSQCTDEYASISAYKEGVCLTVLNLNQMDEYFDQYWGDSVYVSFDDIRDLMLHHELAHTSTLSHHVTFLDEASNSDSILSETIADLSTIHKSFKDHPLSLANELVDGLIKMRIKEDITHDTRQILRLAKSYYSSSDNGSLSISDHKIIEHSALMAKVFDNIVTSNDIHSTVPNFFNHDILPSDINKLSEVPYSYYRKSHAIQRLHNEIGIDSNQVKTMDIESRLDLYAENISIVAKHITASRESANDEILEYLRSSSTIPDSDIDIELFESKMKVLSKPVLDTRTRVSLPATSATSYMGPNF